MRHDNRKKRQLSVAALAFLALPIFCALLLFSPAGRASILAPIAAALCCVALLYHKVQGRGAPMNEIGVYFLAAASLYCVIPLAMYLARGMIFSSHSDNRLLALNPSLQEMAAHGWRYVGYIAAFTAMYLLAREKRDAPSCSLQPPSRACVRVGILIVLFVQGLLVAYSAVYGFESESYADWNVKQAAMRQQVPLLLRQIMDHTERNMLALKVFLLVWLFSRYRKHRALIWLWVGLEVAVVVVRLGARTPAVLTCLAVVFLYHRFVRPVSHFRAAAFGGLLILGFTFLGIVRSVGPFSGVGVTEASNEFEVLFATGLDIQRRADLGSLPAVPLAVRFADILALIPSQVLSIVGIQKMTGAEWYLELMGLSGAGVGFGFGPLAESAAGFGWPELIARGALVGLALARLQSWYNRNAGSFWTTVVFVWVVVLSYTSVRSSTAQLVALVALQFLPVYLVLRLFDGKARYDPLERSRAVRRGIRRDSEKGTDSRNIGLGPEFRMNVQ